MVTAGYSRPTTYSIGHDHPARTVTGTPPRTSPPWARPTMQRLDGLASIRCGRHQLADFLGRPGAPGRRNPGRRGVRDAGGHCRLRPGMLKQAAANGHVRGWVAEIVAPARSPIRRTLPPVVEVYSAPARSAPGRGRPARQATGELREGRPGVAFFGAQRGDEQRRRRRRRDEAATAPVRSRSSSCSPTILARQLGAAAGLATSFSSSPTIWGGTRHEELPSSAMPPGWRRRR